MWPFSKKQKRPEVKLECPHCKQTLEKYSKNQFKCPHCRDWIYFWDGCLVTKEENDRLKNEYYRKRHEERLKQTFAEDLAKLGLNKEMLQRREQELLKTTGVPPKKAAVILSLFNETILKLKDLNEMETRYYSLAIILNKGGEESFHILKAVAKTKLAALKKEGFKNVSILTSQMCEICKQLDGKVLSIKEALKTMPIPIKECTNYPYNENRSFCTCSYEPECDDEYLMNLK